MKYLRGIIRINYGRGGVPSRRSECNLWALLFQDR